MTTVRRAVNVPVLDVIDDMHTDAKLPDDAAPIRASASAVSRFEARDPYRALEPGVPRVDVYLPNFVRGRS